MGFARMVREDDHNLKMSHLMGSFKKGQIDGLSHGLRHSWNLEFPCLPQAGKLEFDIEGLVLPAPLFSP